MEIRVQGQVWKFGNDVNTDLMDPGFARVGGWEMTRKYLLHTHAKFNAEVLPGDIIIGGRNFGCGSSRETAPANLKRLGIGAVVAESFGRIFFRNCIAVALPILVCPGVTTLFNEGETAELDLETAIVKNVTTKKELRGSPLSREMIEIIAKGGILEVLKEIKGRTQA
jgi:3-isopropylmalate/(R)-2-methylmalate dehydratase small subunit